MLDPESRIRVPVSQGPTWEELHFPSSKISPRMKTTSGCNNHRAVWKALSICHSLEANRRKASVCFLSGSHICLTGHLKSEPNGPILPLPWPHPRILIHCLEGPKSPYVIKCGERRHQRSQPAPPTHQRLTSPVLYPEIRPHIAH